MTFHSTRLLTTRLNIASLNEQHADALFKYYSQNKKHLKAWEPRKPPEALQSSYWAETLRKYSSDHVNESALHLSLHLLDNPDPIIGTINFTQIVRGFFQASYLGFSIDRVFQGRGLMCEALTASIEHVFIELKLHRIMANYIPTNKRSKKILTKLGFQKEGYAKSYLLIDDKWQDHILTSLINTRNKVQISHPSHRTRNVE